MASRYEHFLFPTRSNRQPNAIVSVECDYVLETCVPGPAVQTERLREWTAVSAVYENGHYVNARDYRDYDPAEFWRLLRVLLCKRSYVVVITSSAPSTWALLGLWEGLELGTIELAGFDPREDDDDGARPRWKSNGLLVLEEPTNAAKIKFAGTRGSITLVDSRNYGLAQPGQDPGHVDRAARGFQFLAGMITALSEGNCGALQITSAAQAMYSFRYKHLDHTLLAHTHAEVMALEDEGYVGGRSECYKIGRAEHVVYHLDFSSMYASLCRSESVPVRLCHYEHERQPGDSHADYLGSLCIAKADINTPEPCFPYHRNDLTVYPVGRFRTVLTGPELQHAFARGYVENVHECAYYERERALSSFATYWLAKRDECVRLGLTDLATLCKRMLVGIVGKLGQRGRQWNDEPDMVEEELYSSWKSRNKQGEWVRYRSVAGHVQSETTQLWGPYAVPAAAAWITSCGRYKLYTATLIAKRHNVYYVDTDSLFVNADGYHRLNDNGWIRNGIPGYLRLVERCTDAEFYGYQCYTAGSRQVCSGLSRCPEAGPSPHGYVWIRTGLADALGGHHRPVATRRLVRFGSDRPYKHGRVLDDGTVAPWTLPADLNSIRG